MKLHRHVALIVLALVFGGVLVGCSWVLGVSDEPVVVADPLGDAAAADEDALAYGSGDSAPE